MNQSDIKDLNNLYSTKIINESTEQQDMRKDIEDLKKLYDNPDEAFAVKNYGSVEAYKKMLRNKIEDIVSKLDAPYPVYLEAEQRPKDEVSAEEIDGDGADVEGVEDATEESEKNTEKKVKENINNLTKDKVMTEDKSIFDKLFEQVMGEADDEELELGIDLDGAEDETPAGDDEGSVTITLDKELAAKLHEILMDVLGDEEGEEEPSDETEEGEHGYEEEAEPFEEENQHTNDGAQPGVDPSDGGGKATDPAADSLGGKSAGTGDASATDEIGSKDTGEGKKPGHSSAKNSPTV